MSLEVVPCTLKAARAYVTQHHRHLRAPRGGLFALACALDGEVIGVAIVGRPTARHNQDGWTAEVTRCAVREGVPNACSKLYGAAWRAARALGWRRLLTFTLPCESGASLRAAGWRVVGQTKDGDTWNRRNRPRVDQHPLQAKLRWQTPGEDAA